ncbi:TetR/AcrR family transcriptional regulator [Herbiconiux solani]|uniref:TetR/AcrR family transcriptional regulator n=1 Tax=Herbiconiux solani TaxID=661329 RepID=UPI000827041D|nr:TetR/AcrR family transcriptional regulator [Herbiconiux solani]
MARTREFDETALQASALDAFWSHGFGGTSIGDISAVTGVGNGSIYGAYGSKFELFYQVLEAYCRSRVETVRDAMSVEGLPAVATRHFLDVIIDDCASQPGRRGCLMLNSLSEFGDREPRVRELIALTNAAMELAVAERLRQSEQDGDLDTSGVSVEVLAAEIVMISQGIIQLSRLGAPVERMAAIADSYSAGLARLS